MGPAQTFLSRPASCLSPLSPPRIPPLAWPHTQIPDPYQDFFPSSWAGAILTQPCLSLLAKPLLAFGATHAFAAAGYPRSRSRLEGFLLSPVLKTPPSSPFKAVRFFSLFPLVSPGTRWDPAPGTLLSQAPCTWPDAPAIATFQPQAAGPQRSAGGCWTKGGGARKGGCECCSARSPHSTALARPTLFRTLSCAWLGPRSLSLCPCPCRDRDRYPVPPYSSLLVRPSRGASLEGQQQEREIKVDTRERQPCFPGRG